MSLFSYSHRVWRCIAGFEVANIIPDFVGAADLNRIERFMQDDLDSREYEEWFEVLSDENGVYGCFGSMGGRDLCPKDPPLLEHSAYLRRKRLGSNATR